MYHYIIDTKLLFYNMRQTKRDPIEIFNEIPRILTQLPAGKVYLVSDYGKSAYRLNLSPYYKGKRTEEKLRKSEEEQKQLEQFNEEYLSFLSLAQETLPFPTIIVPEVEADDIASILAYKLAQKETNKVVLITRDQDWRHSIIDHKNVKIVSPYYSEPDFYSKHVKDAYNVSSREEFTLLKALKGDDGDSILHIRYIGKDTAEGIWNSCKEQLKEGEEITLDLLYNELNTFITEHKNSAKFKLPAKYLELGLVESVRDVLELNYKLGRTMISVDELNTRERNAFMDSLNKRYSYSLKPFDDGLTFFDRPIQLDEEADTFYRNYGKDF